MNEKIKTTKTLDKKSQELLTKIGNAIYKARTTQGLTLREVEQLAGVSFMTISNVEKAQADCYFIKLLKVTNALKIDLKDFL